MEVKHIGWVIKYMDWSVTSSARETRTLAISEYMEVYNSSRSGPDEKTWWQLKNKVHHSCVKVFVEATQ